MSYKNLAQFLNKYKNNEKNNTVTHTRIPDSSLNIYGASYNIPKEEHGTLNSLLYDSVFNKGNKEYLTETQLKDNNGENRPLVIDFDFNYDINTTLQRYHDKDTVLNICCLIVEKLKYMFNFSSNNSKFYMYIFERNKPYVCDKKKCIKDGIHILVNIKMNNTQQILLRDMVLLEIDNVLSDLPLINSYSEVYDAGICNGTTAWQMFGCRKPGKESYNLSYYYAIEYYGEKDNDFKCDFIEGSRFDIKNNYHLLSVKYEDNLKYEMNDEFKSIYEKKGNTNKKKYNTLKIRDDFSYTTKIIPDMNNIKNKKELEDICKLLYDNLSQTIDTQYGNVPFKLKECHDIVMILPSEYYNEFDKWIKTGWALYNTCQDDYMFYTWMLFSCQSDKFDFSDISLYYSDKYWKSFKIGTECLTNNSILYWAKQYWKQFKDEDNKLNNILYSSVNHFIQQTILYPTDFDIARVLYHYAKERFTCSDIKNNVWYEYRNHRWNETDSGVALSLLISTDLHKLYFEEMLQVTKALHSHDNSDDEWKTLKQKLSALSDICTRLKDVSKKDKLMKASKELFYDKHFYNRIDANPKLLGFTNGVIDFNTNTFRDGQSSDYLCKSTKTSYIPLNKVDPKIINEINLFMQQLFPIPELCEYMWEMLASCLVGNNNDQSFHIFTGCGSNGKSLLMKLMKFVLGEYHGVVPLSIVTEKRPKVGGVSPEIIQLMGTRLAVINEPSAGDRLNEGPMKALTGGDPIQGRYLFKNMVTFIPQFKLTVCTNVMFDINATDNGTWRRIKVVPYLSTFTENPDSNQNYQFKIDKTIEESKLTKWIEPFTSMLVDIAFKTGGLIKRKCDIVNSKSQEYRNNQDHILNFINEKIVKEPGEKIKKGELCREFDEWYKMNYGKRQPPKQRDLYDVMDKKFGKYVNLGWHNVKINYENEIDDDY
jgi:P4 family phage/plasmid primase-like protien